MMNDYQAQLRLLRAAGSGREWNAAQERLTALLLELDFFAGLEIALTRAHEHLPVFEQHHPEAGWARSLLVWIASYGAAPANLPVEAANPYASPGAANYVKALIDLTRSVERQNPLENRVRFVSSAISNVMLADLAAYWYGEHPDMWAMQQAAGDSVEAETGLTVRQRIYMQFWMDDAVAERDTAAWLALAAHLEKRTG